MQLWHTPERDRWFLVPEEVEVGEGDLAARCWGEAKPRNVDESVLAAHEVTEEQGKEWIDARIGRAFARAGEAWTNLLGGLRRDLEARGRPMPDVSDSTATVEDVIGMKASELYTDPGRTKDAVEAFMKWAEEKTPRSKPRPSEAEAAEAMKKLGSLLSGAAAKIREATEEARKRQAEVKARRKKPLQKLGHFRELRHCANPDGPSLHDARRDTPGPHADAIVAYLRAGHDMVVAPGIATDVIDPSRDPIGTLCFQTDGTWVWPGDLAGYVERYNVRLPGAFLEHAMAVGWAVPGTVAVEDLEL